MYNTGKLNKIRIKTNCGEKGYQKLSKYVKRKVIKHS